MGRRNGIAGSNGCIPGGPISTEQPRIWVAEQSLSKGIAAYRLSVLRQDSESDRPRPYDHPALEDLTPDTEHLVPLREFDFDGSRLLRNGHAFLVLGTQRSPNSTYWLLGGLYSNLRDHVRVRLDPLLHGPASNFGPLHQRMLVYGRSLDWHRIEGIRETDHGRWCPDSQERGSHFTDYAWEPRGSEVTFVCEEVPKLEAAAYEPGRYLHAIYLPSKAAIFHLDGAVRIYTNSEITERHAQHVRKAGKIGLRKKIFRVDDLVPRDVLSSLCQAFFVWNEDVCRYFAAGCKRVA